MTNPDATTPHTDSPNSAPDAVAEQREPFPTPMHPVASRIFLFVTLGMIIAGIVLMVMMGMDDTANRGKGTLATLLLSVGAVGFAAWIVIQVLGRMVLRIMLRKQ